MPDHYQPIDDPFAFARVTQKDFLQMLNAARVGGGARYHPRWAGDGRNPTLRTTKPGAFRSRGED